MTFEAQAKALREIALDLGYGYGTISATPNNKKSAFMLLDAIQEIRKGNTEKAIQLIGEVKNRAEHGFVAHEKKAGYGVGPVIRKQATRNQRTDHSIFRMAWYIDKQLNPPAPPRQGL